jgi:16S rRNA (cytosine1402-N4)-methyltransferase
LRIAVNDELEQLDRALPLAWSVLRGGGVLAGITFHSLEDRRVKRFIGARTRGCICPPDLPVCACGRTPEAALITRRSVVPSAEEVAQNPRASSARLRAARKLDGESGVAR